MIFLVENVEKLDWSKIIHNSPGTARAHLPTHSDLRRASVPTTGYSTVSTALPNLVNTHPSNLGPYSQALDIISASFTLIAFLTRETQPRYFRASENKVLDHRLIKSI